MAYNGSGTWVRLYNWTNDAANNIDIRADRMDNEINDMCGNGLSFAITKDGQQNPTANLPMATFRHTGVGAAVNPTDYARAQEAQNGTMTWGATVSGTANALTISPTPVIAAYVNGQKFRFKTGTATNTTAVTLAVSGLAAVAVQKGDGTVALVAGDISINTILEVTYDSSVPAFVLSNTSIPNSALAQAPTLTLKGNNTGVTANVLDLTVAQVKAMLGVTLLPSIKGAFQNLKGIWTSITLANWTSDQLIVQDSSNNPVLLTAYSQQLNTATTGAGGLDTGTLAANVWYYVFAIYNGTLTNILFSLSPTAPTLPSGYTFSSIIGAFRSDGSKNIVGFLQRNRRWRYLVGNNLSNLQIMASGASGSTTVPTFTSLAVGTFVPTAIADTIVIVAQANNAASSTLIAAPNSNYGPSLSTTAPCPVSISNGSTALAEITLESTNIFYASQANTSIACYGFEINL